MLVGLNSIGSENPECHTLVTNRTTPQRHEVGRPQSDHAVGPEHPHIPSSFK